jgi:hypothetical protein
MSSRCMGLLPRTTLHSDSEHYHLTVPDRNIWRQLARPPRPVELTCDPKSYIIVYIIAALFVLFLLWCVSGLIYKDSRIWALDLYSNQDKPSLAKPSQWRGMPVKASLANVSRKRGFVISLLWERDQDGPLRSSTIDAIATQVCCNGKSFQGETVQWIIYSHHV